MSSCKVSKLVSKITWVYLAVLSITYLVSIMH